MHALHLARPYAIMMVGIPGSGKTFFAEKFSEMFRTPYLDIATIQETIGNPDAVEQTVLYILNEVTKTDKPFVFEGNSASRSSRTEFAKWARSKGYKPLIVWVQTDPKLCRARVQKGRTMSSSEFADQIADFSPPHPDEKPIVISGRHTYTAQARNVLNHLATENRGGRPPVRVAMRDVK